MHRLGDAADARRQRVAELLERVGLRPRRSATAIRTNSPAASASASASPARWRWSRELIVADEPVSALDVSIQAQMHQPADATCSASSASPISSSPTISRSSRHISDRVAVMYLGRIVEIADKTELFDNPRHPYTQALLASVPLADPRKKRRSRLVDGDVPSPLNPPSGCAFHTRCRYAIDRCKVERPALREAEPGHQVACLLNDGTGRAG